VVIATWSGYGKCAFLLSVECAFCILVLYPLGIILNEIMLVYIQNERTHHGNGGSPLWWAKKSNGLKDPVVRYLESIGAEEIPPDGYKKILTEEDVDQPKKV
jgi:hypothetical protein